MKNGLFWKEFEYKKINYQLNQMAKSKNLSNFPSTDHQSFTTNLRNKSFSEGKLSLKSDSCSLSNEKSVDSEITHEAHYSFLKKVYSLLLISNIITICTICLFLYLPFAKELSRRNFVNLSVAIFIYVLVMFGFLKYRESGKVYPTNILQFSVVTIAQSWLLGVISGFFKTRYILFPFMICTVVCIAVVILANFPKYNLLRCSGFMAVALTVEICSLILLTIIDIAAKIHSGAETTGTKRTLEEVQATIGLPETKKIAVADEKGIIQQLASIQAQRSGGALANAITVEEWKVPDKMVGLSRGGEQITRLQAESGCKVQMAADSGGLPDRICTLTGNRQAIEKAKDLMNSIINRGGPPLPVIETNHVPDGHSIVEMMIPGPKVGLVIGKGGETIRNLQERAAVKMVLIQDGPQQTSQEKPLRITGEPDKCEYAKQLVMDLITEKELESLQRGGFEGTNEYGSSAGGQRPGNTHEIMVPKQAVGVVIGKGGDMIKKIQQDAGARVQFLNVKEEGPEDKVCVVTGTPEQIQAASSFINDLIQSVMVRDQQNVGRGRGRGRGDGNPNFNNNPRTRPDLPEVHYAVPANKCGLVIGKGGETVKSINQTSGSYVTLSALAAPSAQDKIFIIRGQPQQIEHAKELINERIGGVGTVIQTQNPQNQQNFAPQYPQQQQFQQAPAPTQPYAPQGWANAYQPWQGQTAQATDPNAAAWAAYYSQYYGQQAHQMQPAAAQPIVAPQPGMPAQPDQSQTGVQQPPAATPAAPTAAAPVGSAVAAQPDYSAAWAEYYRSLGMFREAEMIENQAKTQMPGTIMAAQPGMTFPQAQPNATAQNAAPQSAASHSQPPPASVPPSIQNVQQPSAGAQAPTGVPAPPGHPQAFQHNGPQAQWPGAFAQPFGQQPNAFVGYNYPAYGQQPFAAAAAPQ